MRINSPICSRVEGTLHDWLLHEDWFFDLGQFSRKNPSATYAQRCRGKRLHIKAGYVWDGGSIPPGLWGLFLGNEQTFPCAYCTHDGVYDGELLSRLEADELLLDILQAEGAFWIQRKVIYRAVRDWGDFLAWNHHTKESILKAREFVSLIPLHPVYT